MDRMLNVRLNQYLEINGMINNVKCGCHKGRSTVDHLVRLETEVRKAFAYCEQVVSIFYDMEKAYDLTWRYGILRDLFAAGIRGRVAFYISEYLKPQKFRVRIDGHLSEEYTQESRVPQGEILSATLFALKIRKLTECIPRDDRILASLYVDDLQVSYRHSSAHVI